MEPIFRRFAIVGVMAVILASGDCLMCYSCSSVNGKCDLENEFGTETDCSELPDTIPACYIQKTEGKGSYMDVIMRDCVDYNITQSDLKCSHDEDEEGSSDLCICNTHLCNKEFTFPSTQPPSTHQPPTSGTSLKCYKCDSLENKCEDETPGTEQNCQSAIPNAKLPACSISEATGDEPYLTRGCVDAEDSEDVTCSAGCGGGGCEAECLCTTDLCNENWDSAGGKPTPAPPTSTGVPTNNLQCYVCSSTDGTCDEIAPDGTAKNCRDILPYAKVPACLISKATGDEQNFIRECADAESSDSMTCTHGCSGGGCDTSCFCSTDLCNKNLDSAGWNAANQGHKPSILILLTSFIIFVKSIIILS